MSKIDALDFMLKCRNWSEIALPIATHKPFTRIVLKNGLHFEAPMIHWWDVYDIYFRHMYNPAQLPIEEDDLVVDIGANIGLFTVYAASRTQNTVYAFEPSLGNFGVLKQNVLANGLNNVIPYNLAVSDKNGIELLFESSDSTASRLKSVLSRATEKYIEIPSITLQDIMDSNYIKQIDFLKMDCEGSEGLIMASTSKDYLQRVRKIAMEFHDGISKLKHNDMQKLLEEIGFITAIDWDGKSKLGHLYAWKA